MAAFCPHVRQTERQTDAFGYELDAGFADLSPGPVDDFRQPRRPLHTESCLLETWGVATGGVLGLNLQKGPDSKQDKTPRGTGRGE